ncbi:MAG: hypothetical protein Q9M23_06720, partial [Mariprofundaceae bacterium]|nr:hypothetical protein [Mariprofundaceae bacterium]
LFLKNQKHILFRFLGYPLRIYKSHKSLTMKNMQKERQLGISAVVLPSMFFMRFMVKKRTKSMHHGGHEEHGGKEKTKDCWLSSPCPSALHGEKEKRKACTMENMKIERQNQTASRVLPPCSSCSSW